MAGRRIPGGPQQAHPSLIAAHHHREISALLHDQKELSATYTALKKDLSTINQDLHQLSTTARKLREDKSNQIKELYDKSLNLEAEVRAIGDLNDEHSQVISDVQKLTESKIQLAAEFKALDAELTRVKGDASQLPVILTDVKNMQQELQKGRAAVEFEKKTWAANREQNQAMERHMNLLQREIEMLRAELANAEKRARATAAASNSEPGYMGNYGSRSMTYGGSPYSVQYSMHQGQLMADAASPALYGHPAGSHGQFDTQQPHVPNG